jgi:hypothetical protein
MTNRTRVAALALCLAGLAGACGGGGGSDTHAPPAAKIDPDASGAVVSPINRARTQAGNLEQQQQQVEQQGGG